MKEIDTKNWIRKSAYEWFSSFDNPCYGFDVKMDITKLYHLTKERKDSFFINFLYVISYALNQLEPFRLRIIQDKVVLHDVIHPTYTVMTSMGMFDNCRHIMSENYLEFYKRARKEIEKTKVEKEMKATYNQSNMYDDIYITCIPWLEYETMTHPLPSKNKESSSVPRVCWDKYHVHKDGSVTIHLNITVNHALVDGHDLSMAFLHIQSMLDQIENYIQ